MKKRQRIRAATCTGKVRFKNEEGARQQLVVLARSRPILVGVGSVDEEPMNAYACRYCGGWHVGHASGPGGMSPSAREARRVKNAYQRVLRKRTGR